MLKKMLIANRGEIACRIIEAAHDLNISTLAVYPEDEQYALHTIKADTAKLLSGHGVAAYLDIDQIITIAVKEKCDCIHPGYGFLSENAAFAEACIEANICFIGPTPDQLNLFGDKARARALAEDCAVPLVPGTNGDTSLNDAKAFYDDLPANTNAIIKAIAGGGGRGMRIVTNESDLESAFTRCKSEALSAFGNDAVYIEKLIPQVRHIEIQVIGDGTTVTHLWDRECTLQRNHQKIIEIAPSPNLTKAQRQTLINAALKMADVAHYKNLGTFEFLVDANDADTFYFIEANPRLQVEHTITEAISDFDLVQAQIKIAAGEKLSTLSIPVNEPKGFAIQSRVNMELLSVNGTFKPTGGTIEIFEAPTGKQIRVDHFAYAGYATSTAFDSLLAKLIVHSPISFEDALDKAYRALSAFRIVGIETNIAFLQTLIQHPALKQHKIYTQFVDDNLLDLAKHQHHKSRYFTQSTSVQPTATSTSSTTADAKNLADGIQAVTAPLQGTVISLLVQSGDTIVIGQELAVMEAMKMEHVIVAEVSGKVAEIETTLHKTVKESEVLILIEVSEGDERIDITEKIVDPDYIRPDLQEAIDRHTLGQDHARPEAVARRKKTQHRTARENIEDLIDAGSFVEYGALTIAAQRRRRSVDDLMQNTPADGMVTGIASVNHDLFPDQETQCIVMSYDYMVLAGTQGLQNHRKKDRMFELAESLKIPIILFAEGGGGRPGDTDGAGIAGLDCLAFQLWGKLSGHVPRIGITTGRCFAGNAALLGASDVIIATADANIGMGGPAMIEGGGLGTFTPDEVGPMADQVPNGVVDIAVTDEAAAVQVAKQYLSYFQGTLANYTCNDQRLLRSIIPENRLRIYDVKNIISTLADAGSVLEIREAFAPGMITCFARIEGRAIGIIANNPMHLSGAIDSACADKAARFLQLCDAFNIPVLSLCDTPGIMVGPEIEKTALVRHAARLFVIGSNLSVPFLTIVLRKGYGLGAQAMAGGGFKASVFTVTWPTGEFGGMGLEGAVKLGYKKELEAIADPEARELAYQARVQSMYDRGKAVNYATAFEIDAVIDPEASRQWIMAALKSAPMPDQSKRRYIDTW